MSETSRRVFVALTAVTDEPAHHVMAGVLDAVRNALPGLAIETTSSHAFDLAEDDKPETLVQLVITPADVLLGVYTDDHERADEHARTVDGVVVELPVVADYRPEVTA